MIILTDVKTEEIDALGHDWNQEYTVDKEATCEENGSKSIHCNRCKETKDTVVINALGHLFTDYVDDNNATI